MTLVVVHDEEKILLGLKKRGFGAGRWNGFGGKVKSDETIEQAAKRELLEEAGIEADLTPRGTLFFTFENGSDDITGHLFSVKEFTGEPTESEEMKPQWYLHSEIPYTEMWADDEHWLPLFLTGKNIKGEVHFDNPDSQNILKKNIIGF